MSSSLSPDGLWIKSKLFVNRALDPDREFEERAFWACCALELLGKSALADVSPLLVAIPTDDGKSLLSASGLISGNPSSVQAKTVWNRCGRAFKPFSESEAKQLAFGRNEYIHAAGVGFDSFPADVWWQRYWAQAIILLQHMGRELEEFIGLESLSEVEASIRAQEQNIERRYTARIGSAEVNFKRHTSGQFSQSELRKWENWSPYSASYTTRVECPACHNLGTLYGNEIADFEIEHSHISGEPDPEVYVLLTIYSEAFDCESCHLDLYEDNFLVRAGLDGPFEVEGSGEDIPYEGEYNNE